MMFPTQSELSLDWNIKVLQPVASASLSWMLRLVGSLKASEMKALSDGCALQAQDT